MLEKIEGRKRRACQRVRWLDGIADLMDVSLSELRAAPGPLYPAVLTNTDQVALRWGALPGRPPRGSMPSHLMDEVQSVPELPALGAGLGLGGGTYRSMDQNPQAPPLHPILHPRWPGSCWEGRWREPKIGRAHV